MKITSYKEINPFEATFILEGTSREANLIRKYLIGGVEVYAVDSVLMYINKTSYPSEYIAHRMGMIPIKSKGNKQEYLINLDIKAKSKTTITTNDLILEEDLEIPVKIELFDLLPNQELKLIGKVKKGRGFNHAKFQCGIASYEEKDGVFYFHFETLYQYTAKDLLEKAKKAIVEDIKAIWE